MKNFNINYFNTKTQKKNNCKKKFNISLFYDLDQLPTQVIFSLYLYGRYRNVFSLRNKR